MTFKIVIVVKRTGFKGAITKDPRDPFHGEPRTWKTRRGAENWLAKASGWKEMWVCTVVEC